jgi:hypothetical protein
VPPSFSIGSCPQPTSGSAGSGEEAKAIGEHANERERVDLSEDGSESAGSTLLDEALLELPRDGRWVRATMATRQPKAIERRLAFSRQSFAPRARSLVLVLFLVKPGRWTAGSCAKCGCCRHLHRCAGTCTGTCDTT